jgi:hypothetical protein
MNERIRELAKQCYETGPIGKDGWPEYRRLNEVKFALLIVRECAIVANRAENNECEFRSMYNVVTEHFGVEE